MKTTYKKEIDKEGKKEKLNKEILDLIKMNKYLEIPPELISDFLWIDLKELKPHEHVIFKRGTGLCNYIETFDRFFVLPSLIVCNNTLTIIDGHHRWFALEKFGISKVPVTFVDYESDRILTNKSGNISKKEILEASSTGKLLPPKSSEHLVIDNNGQEYPIIVLSSICHFKR